MLPQLITRSNDNEIKKSWEAFCPTVWFDIAAFVKKVFASKWKVIGWFWLISLGLHTIALMVPLPSSEPLPKETVVKVTQIQKPNLSKPPVNRQTPVPSTAKPKPKAKQSLIRSRSIASQTNSLTVPRPTPTPNLPSTPQSSPSPIPNPSPNSTTPPESETGTEVAAFSKSLGASQGCNQAAETCWQIQETQWRAVAVNLEKHLEDQGFEVTKLDELEDDTGMGIYEVSRLGTPKSYLHLLLTDQGTVYLLKDKLLNRGELEQAVGV
jgi:hypothetical protein